ncbi:MAG: NFACT family protein [Thermoproteota archaeon]|nr:NFACT family protein [Thermoproteota archaeon]
MSISEIELKFLVNHVRQTIDNLYYVSNVYPINKNSFIIKFHHSQKNDISLLVSTDGISVTKYTYSVIEENETLKKIKSQLERCKLMDISIVSGERIIKFLFQNIEGIKYYLIVELFGDGNIILCNDSLKIISLINSINVRHRTLKPGLNYFTPPSRGANPFSIDFSTFLSLRDEKAQGNPDVKRWLGRSLSISKKFIEFAVGKADIGKMYVNELSIDELMILYDTLISLINDVSNGVNHEPCIVLDEKNRPDDVYPFVPLSVPESRIKKFDSYVEAVDEYLNIRIINGNDSQGSELSNRISVLEHDIEEQEKAKSLVISKSTKLREFALFLKKQPDHIVDRGNKNIEKIFNDYNIKISSIKGKSYMEIEDEKVPVDLENLSLPKLSSSLFNIAKEKERGLVTIENSQTKLVEQINKLKHQQKNKTPLSHVKVLPNKEWYEKYRWFFTRDNLLAIGGRDASSNSIIIRKYLTENDYVFHAEVHGSPFFILKNANNVDTDISSSISETAQATVSFSRAWKDSLSNSDAYWVLPSQIKKGAPTGQYLPKGSFVIEGKRNYVKNLEIKLAVGLSFNGDRLLVIVGPYYAIKKRSIFLRTILPSGLDIVKASKKIKSDFVEYAMKNDFSKDIVEDLKSLSIDEVIRVLPVGQCKLLPLEKGDIKDIEYKTIEK